MATGPESQSEYAWLATDAIARHANVRPDSLAAQELDTGRRLTYRELDGEVARCEALLRSIAAPGARIAILARNRLHHVVLFYGCARAGAVFVPLNWRLSGVELGVLLQDASPTVLIYEAEFETAALEALQQQAVDRLYRIDGPDDPFADALVRAEAGPSVPIDPLAPCMLLYTSGTTGRPKGVIVTPKTAFFSAMNFTFVSELAPQHGQLCDVPLFHVVGLLAIMHGSVLMGARMLISDRFVPEVTLRRLSDPDLAISHYFCVPQIAQALVENPGFAATPLAGLRLFTGGAPMPVELTLALADAGIKPSNGYGMSENGSLMGVPLDIDLARRKVGSAGVPVPALEVRLVGPDGLDVAPGEAGEVWLRGPSVTPGYWNAPEATAATFQDGWFRTGDAARRDEDGFYFIVDRWKDMYISGGENVYPAEVEAALTSLEAVAEAAVIGVPDRRWGEVGCAYVVVRPSCACDLPTIAAWCDQRLARYKRPAHVRFTDSLPRTASGKVKKDLLRRQFADAHQTESQS